MCSKTGWMELWAACSSERHPAYGKGVGTTWSLRSTSSPSHSMIPCMGRLSDFKGVILNLRYTIFLSIKYFIFSLWCQLCRLHRRRFWKMSHLRIWIREGRWEVYRLVDLAVPGRMLVSSPLVSHAEELISTFTLVCISFHACQWTQSFQY